MAKKDEKKDGAEFESWQLIKYVPGSQEVTLQWDERRPGNPDPDTGKRIGHNPPRAAFTEALHNLREYVADIFSVTGAGETKRMQEYIEVRGIKYKLDKKGRKAQFLFIRNIPDGEYTSKVPISTPFFYTDLFDDESDEPTWTPECIEAIERLEDAARAYLDGDFEPLSELTGKPLNEDGPLFADGGEK